MAGSSSLTMRVSCIICWTRVLRSSVVFSASRMRSYSGLAHPPRLVPDQRVSGPPGRAGLGRGGGGEAPRPPPPAPWGAGGAPRLLAGGGGGGPPPAHVERGGRPHHPGANRRVGAPPDAGAPHDRTAVILR